MKYVSFDIETTGLDPETCDVLEIGAVIDDLSKPMPYDQLPIFQTYVLPWRKLTDNSEPVYQGQPYALNMNSLILGRISSREKGFSYMETGKAVCDFYAFLKDNGIAEKTVFAGKNIASFDLPFVSKLPYWNQLIDRSPRSFDPTPFYTRVEDKTPPSLQKCLERAGISSTVKHHAVDDSMQIVKLIRRAMLTKEEFAQW